MTVDTNSLLWQPAAVILLLMFTALLIRLGGKALHKAAPVLTVLSLAGGIIMLLPLASGALAGNVTTISYRLMPPFWLSFRVDTLSLALALLFQFLAAILALYTSAYPLGDSATRFRAVYLFVAACSVGVVLAGDLLSLFLFFEGMSLVFFILVIHNRDKAAIGATFKFLYMTIGGSVLYFIALGAVFFQAGSFAWTAGGFMPDGPYSLLAFIGFAAAFGMKAGMVPLHIWMPDAYGSAPVPAATLSSMIMLKTGAYGMVRIVHHVFGTEFLGRVEWQAVILTLAVVSIIYGSICAFAERDLMRRLAFSGVAQLGYILLGISLLTQDALAGSFYHFLAHAMMKGTLLLCAGAILVKTGKRNIADLAGIGWQMPLTMCCFSLASLTAVGLPPMNIFISKWYLSLGILAANKPLLILVLLLSSMLNAAYYLPIAFTAFFGERNRDLHATIGWDSLPAAMSVAIVALTVGCLIFGLSPYNFPLEWAKSAAAGFF
jgi:multicomponent Na+:H+ antiporter subunit D